MEVIEAFWAWWEEGGRAALEEAIETGGETALPEQVTALVQAIHPALQWQLGPGTNAMHSFTVSPDGDPELRGITEVWLREGPDSDADWEFHAARQPFAGPVTAGGLTIDPADVTFAFEYDELYEQLDIAVDHADLAEATPDAGLEAAFALLEAVIGEDHIERWVGIVNVSPESIDGRPLTELPAILTRFTPNVTGEQWEEIETADVSGWEEHLRINRALKAIDNLPFNIHLEVRVEMLEHDRLALPTDAEWTALETLAEALAGVLGSHAVAMAVDTVNRHQALHYYVDDVEGVEELVDDWIGQQPDRTIEAMFMIDPAWNNSHRWD